MTGVTVFQSPLGNGLLWASSSASHFFHSAPAADTFAQSFGSTRPLRKKAKDPRARAFPFQARVFSTKVYVLPPTSNWYSFTSSRKRANSRGVQAMALARSGDTGTSKTKTLVFGSGLRPSQ